MDDNIAYCGVDCSQCPSFQATMKKDDIALESIARRWPPSWGRITARDAECEGCFGPRLSKYCRENCAIRPCASGKNIKNCAFCNEYKCHKLAELTKKFPKLAERLEAIRVSLKQQEPEPIRKETRI